MSRNRMKNSQSMHWMGVVKWILITGLLAGLGLCYMICKNQNLHLAEQTQNLKKQLAAIELRNQELEGDLQHMKSKTLLRRQLAVMHSSLVELGDARLTLVRLDQDTRARIAASGTMPTPALNYDSVPVASSGAAPQRVR